MLQKGPSSLHQLITKKERVTINCRNARRRTSPFLTSLAMKYEAPCLGAWTSAGQMGASM